MSFPLVKLPRNQALLQTYLLPVSLFIYLVQLPCAKTEDENLQPCSSQNGQNPIPVSRLKVYSQFFPEFAQGKSLHSVNQQTVLFS